MQRGVVIALVLAIGCGNDRATPVAGIGPAPLRRLSNTEYLYALNDLFPAIQLALPPLPADNSVSGFENEAQAQAPSDVRIARFDSVIEGNGTMLDNTLVVWLTELATPHHFHNDTFTLIAGGGNLGLRTGRYVRYPRTFTSPQANHVLLGPATNRLHVSVLRAMGQPDDSFGLTSVPDSSGGTIPLVGPLAEVFS